MSEENITPSSQPAGASQQPPTEVKPAESKSEGGMEDKPKPVTFTFSQKVELVRKKYEYINKQGMDAVAAEAAARHDLGLPEMTMTEKEKAAKPNIFQRMLKMLGITALLNRKKGNSEEKADEELPLASQPTESSEPITASPEVALSEEPKTTPSVEKENAEAKPASAEDSPFAENTEDKPEMPASQNSEIKPEDKSPQQPQV